MRSVFSLLSLLLVLLSVCMGSHAINVATQQIVISVRPIIPTIYSPYETLPFDADIVLVDIDDETEEPAGSCERPLFIAFNSAAPKDDEPHARSIRSNA